MIEIKGIACDRYDGALFKTMRVSEAVNKWDKVLGKEIEVEGIAEVASSMSVIYEDVGKRNVGDPISPGILVHGNDLKTLVESLPNPLSPYVGSQILYVVKVRMSGIVANTGHTFAPLMFGHIYEIEFNDEQVGVQTIVVNGRLCDVTFKIERKLKATEVKQFERYFPSFRNMIELKKYLESGDVIVLVKRVSEAELSEHVGFLKKFSLEYELKESPIENGFWGLP